MPQEDRGQASKKAPRTQIEDLSPPVEELSEQQASLASGGAIDTGEFRWPQPPTATRVENTCTGGRFLGLPAPDTDYAND